jgi:hypothetical protein
MTYDPLTGENWDRSAAAAAWAESMARVHAGRDAPLRWQLHGAPGHWQWVFWNFGTWAGSVEIERTGFAWRTRDYGTGRVLHSGLTTSLYEAYQSVEQNKRITRGVDRMPDAG